MKRNQIRFIVILGSFAIIGIIVIQIYWMQKAWNIKEKQFNQTIFIGLKNVAEKLSIYTQTDLPNENPVNQLSSNYFVVNTNSVIDVNVLDHYLRTEFSLLNIDTDYEYAIYDCHNDQMVYGNYVSVGGKDKNKEQKMTTNMPKYSDYIYYFGVRFPSKTNSLTGDMGLWIIFSAILVVSLIFFAYAIFIILRQKRLSELQKDFINNMTHEFKTPISSINISADVISNPSILADPERLIKYGSIIKQENSRLNKQVEKVLQIARIEKSGFELKNEEISLNEIILEVVDNCKTNNGKEIKLLTSLDEDIGIIYADRLHITNIFHNLLDNAIKYSTGYPEITFTTKIQNQTINIMVSDNGPGIGKEYQKKVFQKFFRVPTGNVHDVKGFGLGLYYVKNICSAHGWKIFVNSEINKGSTFVIEIPVK
ncbi:MAG: HAMP domain-containing histidine kinase [Bacteroidales bacterium]|nr:HAMP domain-containing histidine kinase [Bacteroidales bacterium]